MKISKIRISNFRGISDIDLKNLGSMVIVAGQNGSGKSCVFDAIRLLKSIYGGYQPNEWHHWASEFQINLANLTHGFRSIFNNPNEEVKIRCEFEFSDTEKAFILNNSQSLLLEKNVKERIPEAANHGSYQISNWTPQFKHHESEIKNKIIHDDEFLKTELAAPAVIGELTIKPGEVPHFVNSVVLAVAFGSFRPMSIGVIDYHGAQRNYAREGSQGFNFNVINQDQQRSQTALYNYAAKYSNVKGEMATSYIRELLAEKSGKKPTEQPTLTETLQDLFKTFFPDKEFMGPVPTGEGMLSFPVCTSSGSQHDLDELSSGEKEILYGYLRIRNSAPQHSIILLDEPELHLNPRLIRGLPQFYKKKLGLDLNNQIWLVTHSDALLREVVGQEGYDVFHMLPCGKVPRGESQLRSLAVSADLDMALIDMVGDLAAYRPSGKIIILEGGGDSDFDQKVLSKLFPELLEQATVISGTNKVRVKALHQTLNKASEKGKIPYKFYAITDKDNDTETEQNEPINFYTWDVYHIENYFLEPYFISKVLKSITLEDSVSEEEITELLKQCARDSIDQLVRHELETYANTELKKSIKTATSRTATNLSELLFEKITLSASTINEVCTEKLSLHLLLEREKTIRNHYNESIENGNWRSVIKGRDILNKFVHRAAPSTQYETFRNLIIQEMANVGYQPSGMREVISQIKSN